MRLFLGIELEDPVRAACAAAARDLSVSLRRASSNVSVRWIVEENLHITLWFLGNVPDDRSNAIGQVVGVPWRVDGFTISLAGAGAFPPAGPLRIIWLGLDHGIERMEEIYAELASRLGPLGFVAEKRPYHPHITIGRVKESSSADSRKARNVLSGWSVRPGTSQVRAVTLFQSRLSPAGARYEPLLRVPLKGC
jgi:2'-5' RNA ligase